MAPLPAKNRDSPQFSPLCSAGAAAILIFEGDLIVARMVLQQSYFDSAASYPRYRRQTITPTS
jgi:hypothetical protein